MRKTNVIPMATSEAAHLPEGTAITGQTAATVRAGMATRNQRRTPLDRSSLTEAMFATVTSYRNQVGKSVAASGATTRNARYGSPKSARTMAVGSQTGA